MQHNKWRPTHELGRVGCLTPSHLYTLNSDANSGQIRPSTKGINMVFKPNLGSKFINPHFWVHLTKVQSLEHGDRVGGRLHPQPSLGFSLLHSCCI